MIWSDSLDSWAIKGPDDGVSSMDIDRREDNSNLNGSLAVTIFGFSRYRRLGRIGLRQSGTDHKGNSVMVLNAFEVFEAVAGLQETVSVKCSLRHLQETEDC
jgi:hypothetical protein